MANARSKAVEEEKQVMNEAAKETSTSKQATKKKPKIVSLDTPLSEVLEYVENGDQLFFDHDKFLELPESVVRDMPHEQAKDYAIARSAHMRKTGQAMSNYEKRQKDWASQKMNLLGGNAIDKLKVIAERDADVRKNYELRWLTPYDYRNWAEGEGYHPVRSKETQKMIVVGPEDAPELMLCEVPRELIERHRKARSEISRGKVGKAREDLMTRTEELNRSAGATRESEMKVVEY